MTQPRPTDGELYETFVYLLGRALVARQERLDLAEQGVDYNVIKYNPVGSANFVNPNLDVAYLEAWIAVDEHTPVTLTLPAIEGRYSTAQLADEWGDVIANINERSFPEAPHGEFVLHAPGYPPPDDDTPTIELHSRKAKLLARVEIAGDIDGAVALQHAFKLTANGTPQVAPPLDLPDFDNSTLIGAELFDHADALLDDPPDPVATLAAMRDRTRAVAAYATAGPDERDDTERRIATDIVPRVRQEATAGVLPTRNGWLGANRGGRYGDAYHVRTAQNLVGIWANDATEVIYYVGTRDADGHPYEGGATYTLDFPADGLPAAQVHSYWSIILVDVPDFRVVPNPIDRYHLNTYSPLVHEPDGALCIDIAPQPIDGRPQANWLPSPTNGAFSLTLRLYVPRPRALEGHWFPPALRRNQ